MTRKLLNLLFLGFVLHLLVSALFIISPSFFPETRFSRIYKTYLLPGPFFRDDRITTSYNLTISWRRNGQWSAPYNETREYFTEYYSRLDPRNLYVSRYLRATYQMNFFE